MFVPFSLFYGKMSRRRKALIIFLVVSGFALILYPSIQMIMSSMHQTVAVSQYEDGILHYDEKMKRAEIEKAEEYNGSITGDDVHDPFIPGSGIIIPDNYYEILDVDLGMMGTLEIPCINVNLPIYHGVSEDVLKKGVGHLKETAFPIGGEGNHTVLSTHRGLPEAKLFTDLNKMEIGDEFYIHIFDDVLAYKVDQIKVVEPSDTTYLKPVKGGDHVTLLTCTPYGINSHRLLVRGIRTEYVPEIKEQTKEKVMHTEWYAPVIIFVILPLLFMTTIVRRFKRKRQR